MRDNGLFDDKFLKKLKYMKRRKARNKARNRYAVLKNEVTKSNKGNDPLGIPNVNFSILDWYTDSEKDVNRLAKFKQQRIERGFDDTECWNLDTTIAQFVLPRLKHFKENTNGYPGNDEIPTFEKWNEVLDKMIYAFDHIVNEDKYDEEKQKRHGVDFLEMYGFEKQEDGSALMVETPKYNKQAMENYRKEQFEDMEKVNEGLQLFGKYFRSLWW